MQAVHGVIQMGHMVRPCVHRQVGRFIVRAGVGDGQLLLSGECPDKFHGPLLRRIQIYQADMASRTGIQFFQVGDVRFAQILRVVTAFFVGPKERPFQVDAPDPGAAGLFLDGLTDPF